MIAPTANADSASENAVVPENTFVARSQGRRNNFDFLRFALASLVLWSHCYPLILGDTGHDILRSLSHGQTDAGSLAVNGFFSISGYLILGSWLHSKGLGDYLRKRALRIFPGFAVALLFCIFVVGPLSGVALGPYFRNKETYKFFSTFFFHGFHKFLPGVFSGAPYQGVVNGSLWTIEYEFFCYLVLAAGGVIGLASNRLFALGMFAAAYLWSAYGIHGNFALPWWGDMGELPRFLACFLAGSAFHLYQDKIPYSRVLAIVSGIALLLSLRVGFKFVYPIFGTYVLFYLAFLPSPFQHWGRQRDLSYGLYLYAFPIQQLLAQYGRSWMTPLSLFLFAWPITGGLAFLSWHLVEQPFLRRKSPLPRSPVTDITSESLDAATGGAKYPHPESKPAKSPKENLA